MTTWMLLAGTGLVAVFGAFGWALCVAAATADAAASQEEQRRRHAFARVSR